MNKRILTEALRMAIRHLPNHPAVNETWMHWSFIVVDNKIVEWGTNLRGQPPIHYAYNKKIVDVDAHCKLHSEIVAYRRAKKLLGRDLGSFEVINVRLNKQGHTKISAPCCCCAPLLKELGCTRFYYTTDAGWGKLV
jgi:hypothetical protein